MPPNTSMRSGRPCKQQEADCPLAGGRPPPAQTPGTRARAQTPGLVGRSLCQSHHPGETGLFAEAGGTHAVPHLSGSRLAHWLRQRGKCQQGGCRSTVKGAGMRWERHTVNPVLVLRNAVCNRRWSETWQHAVTQRRTARTQRRHERSHHRLRQACWTLASVGVRLHRISHPPVPVSPPTMGSVSTEMPARRPASGYSWRKPFLRRPLSPPVDSEKVGAKK